MSVSVAWPIMRLLAWNALDIINVLRPRRSLSDSLARFGRGFTEKAPLSAKVTKISSLLFIVGMICEMFDW